MQKDLPQIGQWNSFDELRRMQEAQLPCALDRAVKSPFYRDRVGPELTLRSLSDLRNVRPTTKTDMQSSYPFGMLAVPRDKVATYHETSGTSGGPVTPSFYTDMEWLELMDRFVRKSVPITNSDTLLVRTPYAFGLAAHLAHQAGRMAGAAIVPGDGRTLAAPYSRIIRALRDIGVTLTWSTPTECLVWAAAARKAGYEPARDFAALRALYVGGEPLSPARRERISRTWGVPVVEEYGCTEVGSMAGTCSAGRMHFWADRLVAEVYDPSSDTFSAEGTGHLVVTPLYREAMPLLRYQIEDAVEIRYTNCECGWHLPTIKVFGRYSQMFEGARAEINQYNMEDVIYRLPEEYGVMFWRARMKASRVEVEVEVENRCAGPAIRDLNNALKAQFGTCCTVSGVRPGTLVPHELLANVRDVVKPRRLFGEHEDWDAAILRC